MHYFYSSHYTSSNLEILVVRTQLLKTSLKIALGFLAVRYPL